MHVSSVSKTRTLPLVGASAGLLAALLSIALPILVFLHEAAKFDLLSGANPDYVGSIWKALGILVIEGIPVALLAFLAYNG